MIFRKRGVLGIRKTLTRSYVKIPKWAKSLRGLKPPPNEDALSGQRESLSLQLNIQSLCYSSHDLRISFGASLSLQLNI